MREEFYLTFETIENQSVINTNVSRETLWISIIILALATQKSKPGKET